MFAAIGTLVDIGLILLGPFCWIWVFPGFEAEAILQGKEPEEISPVLHGILIFFMLIGASNLNDKMQGKDD